MRVRVWLLLGSCLATACGSSPLKSSNDGSTAGDVGVAETSAESIPDAGSPDADAREVSGDCPPGIAAAAELAATPRADENLELLALKVSPGKLVADEAAYQRVVRDVGAIRAKAPALAKISLFPYRDGRRITLTVPVDTATQMEAGTYHAWDCLNDTYGAVLPAEYIRIGNAPEAFVSLKTKGIYAMPLLAAEYRRLPGVMHVDDITLGGDGPTICLTGGASTWHYLFDDASGDCPAGCIDHAYRHFTTDTAGTVTELEAWNSKQGTPRPDWVTQYGAQDSCH
jgi:hypothetical protein